MPGKSRHNKRKHLTVSKERRERRSSLNTASSQSVESNVGQPTPISNVDSRSQTPMPRPIAGVDASSYVKKELLGITILSTIMLLIMIALFFIFR